MRSNRKIVINFVIAIIGTIICFVGDMLLGCFYPSNSTGISMLFPAFSEEWANINGIRFVFGAICGVIALLMMFCGFYAIFLSMEKWKTKYRKIFLIASFVFVSVGTVYHCVFAITAWIYNKLIIYNPMQAEQISKEFFNTFIFVAMLAAVGFVILSYILFLAAMKGVWKNTKGFILVNPILFMVLSVLLAKLLPQNAIVTGVFDWGQQSISLLLVFSFFLKKSLMIQKQNSHECKEVEVNE
ncbi:MAG: hypothetical protein J1E85_02695 [Ruminococcus sp.]|nr:hypothetical protein [Ruminococcus sp.]